MMIRGFVWFAGMMLLSINAWTATCPYLIIYNETDLKVDVDVLCQTAEEINKRHGIQTVVYLDGGNYATKDDWFEHLDKIEFTLTTAEGADVRRTSGYNDIVLLLEAAPSSRFAAVAYGTNVQELHSNSKWTAISNELETNISNTSGDATQALNTSMQVVGAPAEMGMGTKIVLGFLALVALAVVVVVVRSVISKKRKAKQLAEARLKRVEALWGATGNLVTASDALLGGNTIADTELYKLWVLYYGDRQATQHQEVLNLIATAQQVYQKAFAAFEQLSNVYSSDIGKISDSDLKGLEALYLTLRGTEPLTTEEINALLDPVQLPDEPEPQQSELLSQVNQVLVKLSSDSIYNAPVESVGLNTANTRGVLGYISAVKQHIAVLAEAVNRLMPLREKVEKDFKQFSLDAIGFPQLSADTVVSYFRNALSETDNLLTSHQYIACDDYLNALAALLEPGYWNQAIKATEQNIRQAEAIRQTGILFGLAEHTLKETISYQNQIINKLTRGLSRQEILALTKEMLIASQKTLETMRQRERIKNTFAQECQRIEQMVREFDIDNQPQAQQLKQLVAPYGSEEQSKVLQKLGQVPDEAKSLNQLARAKQLFESSEQPYEAAWRMMMDVREDYDIEDLVALGMQEFEKLKTLEQLAQEKLAELTTRFEQIRRSYGYHFADSDENAINSGLGQVRTELARKQIYRAHELLNRLAKLIDDAENEARKRKTEQDERDRRKAQSRTVIFGPGTFGGGSSWGGGSSSWGGSKSSGGGFSGGGRSSGGFGGGGRSGGFGGGGRR